MNQGTGEEAEQIFERFKMSGAARTLTGDLGTIVCIDNFVLHDGRWYVFRDKEIESATDDEVRKLLKEFRKKKNEGVKNE